MMLFRIQDEYEWHDWYAYFPVFIHTFYVWNETIQRRKVYVDIPQDCMYGRGWEWEYRIICK